MITIEIRALIRELSPKKVYFYTIFADPDYCNGRTVRWSAGRTFADDCIKIEEKRSLLTCLKVVNKWIKKVKEDQ